MICLIMREGGSGDAIAIAAGALKKMNVVDGTVKEPAVVAHRSLTKPFEAGGKAIDKALQVLLPLSPQDLNRGIHLRPGGAQS
jgi:acetyl-CoA carboxylase alpha subunit